MLNRFIGPSHVAQEHVLVPIQNTTMQKLNISSNDRFCLEEVYYVIIFQLAGLLMGMYFELLSLLNVALTN